MPFWIFSFMVWAFGAPTVATADTRFVRSFYTVSTNPGHRTGQSVGLEAASRECRVGFRIERYWREEMRSVYIIARSARSTRSVSVGRRWLEGQAPFPIVRRSASTQGPRCRCKTNDPDGARRRMHPRAESPRTQYA